MSSSKVVFLFDFLPKNVLIDRREFSPFLNVVQVYMLLTFFKPPFTIMGTPILLILRPHSGCIITNYSTSLWCH